MGDQDGPVVHAVSHAQVVGVQHAGDPLPRRVHVQVPRVQVAVHGHARAGVPGRERRADPVRPGGGLVLGLGVQHDGGPRGVLEQDGGSAGVRVGAPGRPGHGARRAGGLLGHRRQPVQQRGDPRGVERGGLGPGQQRPPGQARHAREREHPVLRRREDGGHRHPGRPCGGHAPGDPCGARGREHLQERAGHDAVVAGRLDGQDRAVPRPVAAPREAGPARRRAEQGRERVRVGGQREARQDGVGGGPPPQGAVLQDPALARDGRARRGGGGGVPGVAGEDEGAGAHAGVARASGHHVQVQDAREPTPPLQVQGVGSGAQPALARRADGLARGGSVDAHGRGRPAGLSRPGAAPGRCPGPGRRCPARRRR